MQPRWLALYEQYSETEAFAPTPRSMARRALKNAALTMLSAGTDAASRRVARTCVQQQLGSADNLTDRRAALAAVVNGSLFDAAERNELLTEFYERWSEQTLVVNLWLQLQASASTNGAGDVQSLETHPCFDARNPNKVRSLIGAFAQHNGRNFHATDGSGYRYLADKIVSVDAANPQLAARLALPLSKWRRFVPALAGPMRRALETVAATQGLSKDVFEIVTKSLSEEAS